MILPNANYAQVNLRFGHTGLPHGGEVTQGIFLDSYAGDPEDLANDAGTHWAESIAAVTSDRVILQAVRVKFGPNATGPDAEVGMALDGDISLRSAPPNLAILMKKETQLGGREGRGRSYWPGADFALINSNGNLDVGYRGDWQDAVDDYYAKYVADGAIPVLLHNSATTPTVITSVSVAARAATQRRRLRR